jgi:hypothetical protein
MFNTNLEGRGRPVFVNGKKYGSIREAVEAVRGFGSRITYHQLYRALIRHKGMIEGVAISFTRPKTRVSEASHG